MANAAFIGSALNTGHQDVSVSLVTLELALKGGSLSETQHLPLLRRLKELARTAQVAAILSSDQAISTLSTIGLSTKRDEVSREALKCLANVLLLQPETRQTLVNLGQAPRVAERLQINHNEDQFLCCRILFLLTYQTSLDFAVLFENHALAKTINEILVSHVGSDIAQATGWPVPDAKGLDLTLCEVLKLIFNVTYHFHNLVAPLIPTVTSITRIIRHEKPFGTSPLEPPVSLAINALLNFIPVQDARSAFFPTENMICNLQALIATLDDATLRYTANQMEASAEPLLTLIRNCFESAPQVVRQSMKLLLLPSQAERMKPLGQGESLASRLLRLSSSAQAPHIGKSISTFFFELSDKDTEAFIHNVGYGYASGFLADNNISVPTPKTHGACDLINTNDVQSPQCTGSADQSCKTPQRVTNFVTGQFLDQEPNDELPPMTDEEKIREAERLFILFERLKGNGIINVENPIRAAVESGRFEKIE